MNMETRIKNLFKGMWEDTQAVSPIVATLVLVVVAITGAAAVGTIMGSFSSGVSDQSNTGDISSASQTELLIAGSTTVQPVSELLAEAYMADNHGVKVTVQAGGSGAGVSSAGMGISDIGAASREVDSDELDKWPDLQTHQIGGSAVVVIGHIDLANSNVSKADLITLYNASNESLPGNVSDVTTVYQRAESSGTEETFAKYLFGKKNVDDAADDANATQKSAVGNAGVLAAVEDTDHSIGFVDFGFAERGDKTKIKILGIYDPDTGMYSSTDVTKSNIRDELRDRDGKHYVTDLTRPLNYITKGEPTSVAQAFINFAQSPGATEYFEDCGYFAVTEFA